MKTAKEVIEAIETIIARSDLPPVCLESEELDVLVDAVILLKRYVVLKNKVEMDNKNL